VHGSDRRDTTQQQQHQNPRIETVGGLNLNSTRRRQEEEEEEEEEDQDGKILIGHLKQESG
jgi:hypothetical protein